MINPSFRLAFLAGLCIFSYQSPAAAQPFCAEPPFAEWPASPVPLGVNADQVSALQANQDGFADLAWVEFPDLEGAPSNLWLALSDGNGGFQAPAVATPLPAHSGFLLPGDFNQDGHEDLLVYPNSSENRRLYTALGDGAGGFTLVDAGFILNPTTNFAVVHLNDDAYPDAVHYDFFGGRLLPYIGNGDGTFQSLPPVSAGFRTRTFGVADVNGDGIDDIGAADSFGLLLLYSNQGTPLGRSKHFSVALQDPSTVRVPGIVAGLFNDDEHADFAGISAGHIHVWIGDGTGDFTAFAYPFERGDLLDLQAADLNGDGLTDLLLRDEQTGQWFSLAAQPAGGFGDATPATTAQMSHLLHLRDLDGDGKIDLIGGMSRRDAVRLFRNTCPLLLSSAAAPDPGQSGEGIEYRFGINNASDETTGALQWTLAAPPELNPLSATPTAGTCSTATSCALGPLNPGQSVEVTVDANLAAGFIGDTGPTATVSALGVGPYSWKARHWAAPRVVPRLDIEVNPRIAAVNQIVTVRVSIRNDGVDLARNVVLRLTVPASVGILSSTLGPKCAVGNAGEAVCALGDLLQAAASRVIEFELRALAETATPVIVRADFSSDEGFPGSAEASLTILDPPAVVTPSFVLRQVVEADPVNGFGAGFVAKPPQDLNRDGNVDLFVYNLTLLGSGDGGFTDAAYPPGLIYHSTYPGDRALADLNGDGFPDLISPGSTWKGNPSGLFTETFERYLEGEGTLYHGLAVADFNEDGRIDIAAGPGCRVHILFGDGNGGHTAGPILDGCFLGSLTGDFNGDGHQDVITHSNSTTQPPVVHLGDGMGGFTPTSASVLLPSSLELAAAADFTGDGVWDLAYFGTLNGVESLHILAGDGSGAFAPFASAPQGAVFPSRPVVADWDLDGKPDLLAASANGAVILKTLPGGALQTALIPSNGVVVPLAVADVDNDGDLDLIGRSGSTVIALSDLVVLLNTGPIGVHTSMKPDELRPGDVFVIETHVQNTGLIDPLTNVELQAALPAGAEIRSFVASPALRCSKPELCTADSVSPGERIGWTIQAALSPDTRGTVGTELAVTTDQSAAPLVARDASKIVASAAVSAYQRMLTEPLYPNKETTLRVAAPNHGDLDSGDVDLAITLLSRPTSGPGAPVQILSITPSQGSCQAGSPTEIGCTLGVLLQGEEAFVDIEFQLPSDAEGDVVAVTELQSASSYGGPTAFDRWPISDAPLTCSYSIAPIAAPPYEAFPLFGGSVTVDVTPDSCTWKPTADSPWLSFFDSNVTGDTTLRYSIGPLFENRTRTGRIFIGDQVHTVTQKGDDGCTYVLSSRRTIVDASGGSGSFTVSRGLNCPVTPLDDRYWIDVSLSMGSFSDIVHFEVAPNFDGQPRSGRIVVGGQIFEIIQGRPRSNLGVYVDGFWFVDRNGDFTYDPASESVGWGGPGFLPVRGDWNGDGFLEVGVYHNGYWFLDRNGDGLFDPATETVGWGLPGWTPVPGDWNGDGVTDLGVVTPDFIWFRDLNGDGLFDPATEMVGWGGPGDTPVVGDWNGDGKDDIGVFAAGQWFLDLNGDGQFDPATEIKGWGGAGWTPMVGDWNGDGVTNLGAVSPDLVWYRDLNGDYAFNPATEILGWGLPGEQPVVGDWNGDGKDNVGVYSGGKWVLDLNGDGKFDPATEIKAWGAAGWRPVPGPWR